MNLVRRLLLPSILTLFTLVGCAAPTEPTDPPEEGNVQSAQSALMLDGNCPTITGTVYQCSNLNRALFTKNAFVIFFDLDTWGNERVELTNRGEIPVLVYAAQGFDKHGNHTRLDPGQTIVMERIDEVFPIYHVLFEPLAPAAKGEVHIDARPFK